MTEIDNLCHILQCDEGTEAQRAEWINRLGEIAEKAQEQRDEARKVAERLRDRHCSRWQGGEVLPWEINLNVKWSTGVHRDDPEKPINVKIIESCNEEDS